MSRQTRATQIQGEGKAPVGLAIAVTNTKRGAVDLALYAKYKLFIIGFDLFPK
jgi:hypothetical protein